MSEKWLVQISFSHQRKCINLLSALPVDWKAIWSDISICCKEVWKLYSVAKQLAAEFVKTARGRKFLPQMVLASETASHQLHAVSFDRHVLLIKTEDKRIFTNESDNVTNCSFIVILISFKWNCLERRTRHFVGFQLLPRLICQPSDRC